MGVTIHSCSMIGHLGSCLVQYRRSHRFWWFVVVFWLFRRYWFSHSWCGIWTGGTPEAKIKTSSTCHGRLERTGQAVFNSSESRSVRFRNWFIYILRERCTRAVSHWPGGKKKEIINITIRKVFLWVCVLSCFEGLFIHILMIIWAEGNGCNILQPA